MISKREKILLPIISGVIASIVCAVINPENIFLTLILGSVAGYIVAFIYYEFIKK